ncbi:uncharacterized protein V1510DRAFT_162348 [Dipodascopsis tothii]|uniref:uncharacterized protein n=1 Tax=Dipodascopsis tothii TaxID=44089 RepID=UPI0034CD5FC5
MVNFFRRKKAGRMTATSAVSVAESVPVTPSPAVQRAPPRAQSQAANYAPAASSGLAATATAPLSRSATRSQPMLKLMTNAPRAKSSRMSLNLSGASREFSATDSFDPAKFSLDGDEELSPEEDAALQTAAFHMAYSETTTPYPYRRTQSYGTKAILDGTSAAGDTAARSKHARRLSALKHSLFFPPPPPTSSHSYNTGHVSRQQYKQQKLEYQQFQQSASRRPMSSASGMRLQSAPATRHASPLGSPLGSRAGSPMRQTYRSTLERRHTVQPAGDDQFASLPELGARQAYAGSTGSTASTRSLAASKSATPASASLVSPQSSTSTVSSHELAPKPEAVAVEDLHRTASAASLIFERQVQDAAVAEAVPAVPAHHAAEDHVAPFLDASCEILAEPAAPEHKLSLYSFADVVAVERGQAQRTPSPTRRPAGARPLGLPLALPDISLGGLSLDERATA